MAQAPMEEEECPELVPIEDQAVGGEEAELSHSTKIPVTVITGYLGN